MPTTKGQDRPLDRRDLLNRVSAAALFFAGHRLASGADTSSGGEPISTGEAVNARSPRILRLDLQTVADLAELKDFYH